MIWIRTPLIPGYTATEENIKGIGELIVSELENYPESWDLLSFNSLCKEKYARLGMSWVLEDQQLMTREVMEFLEIAKSSGVKNVQWSGLTKRNEGDEEKESRADNSQLPSC